MPAKIIIVLFKFKLRNSNIYAMLRIKNDCLIGFCDIKTL